MRGPRRVDRGVCRIGNRRKSGSFAYARRPKFLMRSIQTSRSHNSNGGGNTRAALCISLRKVRGSLPPRLYRENSKSKLPDKPLVPQGERPRNGMAGGPAKRGAEVCASISWSDSALRSMLQACPYNGGSDARLPIVHGHGFLPDLRSRCMGTNRRNGGGCKRDFSLQRDGRRRAYSFHP